MKVLRSPKEALQENIKGVALTIGSFDGVHRGHRFLLQKLRELAPQSPLTVVTFDPHPAKVLSSEAPKRLFPQVDQIDVFQSEGVQFLYFLPFTLAMAKQNAEAFAREHIFELFHPQVLVIGYDFAFGQKRAGNFELLKKLGKEYGCQVVKCNPFKLEGSIVSSTAIREMVGSGQMEKAQDFLGRPFYLKGEVLHGRQLGRTIGIPTINLKVDNEVVPALGVYFCGVRLGEQFYFGLTNVGTNPTVTMDLSLKVECYILDFNQDVYGQVASLEFYHKIREEKKFENLEVLKKEIQNDILIARRLIAARAKV